MRKVLVRVLPWVVTAAILAFLFSRIPVHQVLAAARNAAGWFVPAIAGIICVVYLADSFAVWKTFGWFVTPMGLVETLTLRGATYLLALINYSLGQGAFVFFLNRTRRVPVMRAAAAVLLIIGINLLTLLFFSTFGVLFGAETPPHLNAVIAIAYAGLAVYVVILLLKPRFLARWPIFDVLIEAGLTGHLKALAVRVPHVLTLLVMYHVGLHAFGVQTPLFATLIAVPFVLLLAVLPISFQGLGPSQGALIFFFSKYASGDGAARSAQVLAAGLGIQAIAWCVQIAIGLACTRSQLGRTLRQGAKEIPSAA